MKTVHVSLKLEVDLELEEHELEQEAGTAVKGIIVDGFQGACELFDNLTINIEESKVRS